MEKLHKCISAYTYYLLSFWRLTSFKTGLKLYPSPNLTPKCTYLQEVTGKFPLWGPQFGDPEEGASWVFWIWIWNIWEGTCQTKPGMLFSIFGRMPTGPVKHQLTILWSCCKTKTVTTVFPSQSLRATMLWTACQCGFSQEQLSFFNHCTQSWH